MWPLCTTCELSRATFEYFFLRAFHFCRPEMKTSSALPATGAIKAHLDKTPEPLMPTLLIPAPSKSDGRLHLLALSVCVLASFRALFFSSMTRINAVLAAH
jgi:hypothetical protein